MKFVVWYLFVNDCIWMTFYGNDLSWILKWKWYKILKMNILTWPWPELDQRSMDKPWKNHDQTNGCVWMVQDLNESLDLSKDQNGQWLLPTQRSMGKAFRHCKWHAVGLSDQIKWVPDKVRSWTSLEDNQMKWTWVGHEPGIRRWLDEMPWMNKSEWK